MCVAISKVELHSNSNIKSRDSQTGLKYHFRHQFIYNMAESLNPFMPHFSYVIWVFSCFLRIKRGDMCENTY